MLLVDLQDLKSLFLYVNLVPWMSCLFFTSQRSNRICHWKTKKKTKKRAISIFYFSLMGVCNTDELRDSISQYRKRPLQALDLLTAGRHVKGSRLHNLQKAPE